MNLFLRTTTLSGICLLSCIVPLAAAEQRWQLPDAREVQLGGAMLFAAGDVMPAEAFRLGAAQVEITPPVGYRRAGGYPEDISQSVVDPLFAKALVFEQGGVRAALVVCDLCSIGRQVSDPVRQRASQRSGIAVENITVCMTPTHGGPEYYGTLRDLWHDAAVAKYGRDPHEAIDYPALLVERIGEAVERAAKSVRAVRLESGTARLPGIAFNRRFHMRDGSVQFNPGKKIPISSARPVRWTRNCPWSCSAMRRRTSRWRP